MGPLCDGRDLSVGAEGVVSENIDGYSRRVFIRYGNVIERILNGIYCHRNSGFHSAAIIIGCGVGDNIISVEVLVGDVSYRSVGIYSYSSI